MSAAVVMTSFDEAAQVRARPSQLSAPPAAQARPQDGVTAELVFIGQWLKARGYAFTTLTPASQARVNARDSGAPASDLRGIFGWSRPFDPALLESSVLVALNSAGLVETAGDKWLRSLVRFSTLEGELFAHSAWPTEAADCVFFGPDTMRFAALIASQLQRHALPAGARILDVGCGAGPGGIVAAMVPTADGWPPQLVLSDINPQALAFARANVQLAGVGNASLLLGDLYAPVQGVFDLIVANPPYLNDAAKRAYRHGGGRWGEALSVRILSEGISRLAPGGRLVLYTGAAVIEGRIPLLDALKPHLTASRWPWRWSELDPDVFGEELALPAYADAERIAAVALVLQRPPA
jgi:SAM-dependent methyltransferase